MRQRRRRNHQRGGKTGRRRNSGGSIMRMAYGSSVAAIVSYGALEICARTPQAAPLAHATAAQ